MSPALLRTEPPPAVFEPPALGGFERRDGEWCLRLDGYAALIERVTGVDVMDDPGPRELELVRSRLEGCVEAYERDGSCRCEGLGRHTEDPIGTVRELARFFRAASPSQSEPGAWAN